MKLSQLLTRLMETEEFSELRRSVAAMPLVRARLIEAATPALLAAIHEDGAPILVVAPFDDAAELLAGDLREWYGHPEDIATFADPQGSPYERVADSAERVRERLRAVALLTAGRGIVVVSQRGLMHPTETGEEFGRFRRIIERGTSAGPAALAGWLIDAGFVREPAVERSGSFSHRGGIIDVYSPLEDFPARIEFFGDEIDTLRSFNPDSQRSTGSLDRYELIAAGEAGFSQSRLGQLAEIAFDGLNELEMGSWEASRAALHAQEQPSDGPFFASLINSTPLVAHCHPNTVVVTLGSQTLKAIAADVEERAEIMRSDLVRRGEFPKRAPRPYISAADLLAALESCRHRVDLVPWEAREDSIDVDLDRFGAAPLFGGRLRQFAIDIAKRTAKGEQILVASSQVPRLLEILTKEGVTVSDRLQDGNGAARGKAPEAGACAIVPVTLSEGWRLSTVPATVVLTDSEIFGIRKQHRVLRTRLLRRNRLVDELSTGDYVVHIDHGVGRFSGTRMIEFDAKEREYLILEYAGDDRLYVPTDQIDLVSRYVGPGDAPPTITRLGTHEWTRAKSRVRKAVGKLALELLNLYAARELVEGTPIAADGAWEEELEGSFPFVETADQLTVLQQVKSDMESAQPMDRLICGDVGYGKTEIALRAAFKTVLDGKQVAMLVPTTVLAQQHTRTFSERMAAFPVNIETLSRFRSPSEQAKVVAGLADDSVDIVIGTHRLLQKDVAFADLGLLIIDEEQRFGVSHKERLKQLRQNVHVLTLTATPIPRTLHMALVGVRDMSSLDTPPEDRLPIKTYVAEFDEELLRDAISHELLRGGQVFLVHNRVRHIQRVASKVRELLPDARILVAHGQMDEDQLESVMLDFADHKGDVLVCTTIIESGLDIPNANTIIINNADRFGLAQLYQLRGRVGRAASRAYAYLFYEKGKPLSEIAQKRLRTIFEATELGSGFRIAMRDLEIRGAGNLLGVEQSGHIGSVGFDLYCRMLGDAVNRMKRVMGLSDDELPADETVTLGEQVKIDIPMNAHLPEPYLPNLNVRLEIYQRLANVASEAEMAELVIEIEDRFGSMPEAARNHVALERIRIGAAQVGVSSIRRQERVLIFQLEESAEIDRDIISSRLPKQASLGVDQVRARMPRADGKIPDLVEAVIAAIREARIPPGPIAATA